jgi:hypothetical protein
MRTYITKVDIYQSKQVEVVKNTPGVEATRDQESPRVVRASNVATFSELPLRRGFSCLYLELDQSGFHTFDDNHMY